MVQTAVRTHCPTCGARLARPELSICAYCATPLGLGEVTREPTETMLRLGRMAQHEKYAEAMACEPAPEIEDLAATALGSRGLSAVGRAFCCWSWRCPGPGSSGVSSCTPGARCRAWPGPADRGRPVPVAGRAAAHGPRARGAALQAPRAGHQPAQRDLARRPGLPTVYFFQLEFADGSSGEFRYPGRGVNHDLSWPTTRVWPSRGAICWSTSCRSACSRDGRSPRTRRLASRSRAALGLLALCVLALGSAGAGHRLRPAARDARGRARARGAGPGPRSRSARSGRASPVPTPRARLAALAGDPARALAPGASAAEHRARASRPWLRARWVAVWCSIPLVALTYSSARAVLARGPALFAAALDRHEPLAALDRPAGAPAHGAGEHDGPGAAAALRLRRQPSWPSYALAGLALRPGPRARCTAASRRCPAVRRARLRRGAPRRAAGVAGSARKPAARCSRSRSRPLSVPLSYPFHFDRALPPGAPAPQATRGNLQVEEGSGPRAQPLRPLRRPASFTGAGFQEPSGRSTPTTR